MATLPINIIARAFDPNFEGTIAEQLEAMAAALSLQTQEVFALFVVGATEPTSNIGPWAKNGNTWMYFDETVGRFVAFLIPQERLKYVVQIDDGDDTHDPDPDTYLFWLVITENGAPVDVRSWNATDEEWQGLAASATSGFYSRTQVDAFFAGEVAGKKTVDWTNVVNKPTTTDVSFRANKAIAQVITAGVGANVPFENVVYDIGNGYDETNGRFTAPLAGVYHFDVSASIQNTSGSPTDIDINLRINQDGVAIMAVVTNESATETRRRVMNAGTDLLLGAGQYVDIAIEITSTGASTWTVNADASTQFCGHLVHVL